MASAFVFLEKFCFSPKLANISYNYIVSRSSSAKIPRPLKLNHLRRASSEEPRTELIEDSSKFVPINTEDPAFGPPALLLLGFQIEEIVKLRQFLKEMDGEFLDLILCTEDMINGLLWEAIHKKQRNLDASKIAKSLPRICIMSGLTGEEMIMFIDGFTEAGFEGAVFAALVPNSANKMLEEVIEEIMGDHEIMSTRSM